MSKLIRIGLDAMGGDHGPETIIEGAALAQKEANGDFQIVLVGQQERVQEAFEKLKHKLRHRVKTVFPVHHASDSITMDDSPGEAVKRRESSLSVAMQLQKQGEIDAVVSAGGDWVVGVIPP